MKKRIKLFRTLLIISLIFIPIKTLAATGTYTIKSNSSVTIGDTISVSFTISSSKLYYWQAYITYDTSKLDLVSGSKLFQNASTIDGGQSSTTQTLKFKAKKAGTAWVKIAQGENDLNLNWNDQKISYSAKTKSITIKEKVIKTYSSNNYLKSLEVENYKISPTFNKNTLEYNIELPAETKELKIKATKEDQNATISGNGTQKVSEGMNKLKIKVTAENGNVKEYIINATVKELEPIEVSIENQKYTVIRKREQLPQVNSTYVTTTTKINDEEIPALTSEITKYTLVALKDNSGKIELYKYENDKFQLYKELTFNKLTITPISDETLKIPKGYKETKIKINDEEITGYIKDHYPIFKGINIETGEKALYSYDSDEQTIQKFKNTTSSKKVIDNIDTNYIYIITALGGLLIITYLGILINLIKKKKTANKEYKKAE